MQKIVFEKTENIRDFGGTVCADGRTICPGRLIRSRHLHNLTPQDISILQKEYQLSKIIDLRTDREVKDQPDQQVPGAEWRQIPLISESTAGITHETSTDHAAAEWTLPDMPTLYRHIVTDNFSIAQLAKALQEILHTEEGAVLWHCTEGKDRCGIVSALILTLLGADKDTIFHDYLMTNLVSEKRADTFSQLVLQKTGDKKKAQAVRRVFLADQSYLQAAFDAIEEQNGTIAAFFIDKLHLKKGEIEDFRERYLRFC